MVNFVTSFKMHRRECEKIPGQILGQEEVEWKLTIGAIGYPSLEHHTYCTGMNRCYKPALPKNCDYSVRNWTNLDNSVSAAHLIQTPIAVLGIRDILVRIRIRIPKNNTAKLQLHHQYLSFVNSPYLFFAFLIFSGLRLSMILSMASDHSHIMLSS